MDKADSWKLCTLTATYLWPSIKGDTSLIPLRLEIIMRVKCKHIYAQCIHANTRTQTRQTYKISHFCVAAILTEKEKKELQKNEIKNSFKTTENSFNNMNRISAETKELLFGVFLCVQLMPHVEIKSRHETAAKAFYFFLLYISFLFSNDYRLPVCKLLCEIGQVKQ